MSLPAPQGAMPRSYFEGVTEWPEVFQRRAMLGAQGVRINVDPLVLYALLCDCGGGIGITTKALREAVDRHVSVGGFPFKTKMEVEEGLVLMLPDLPDDAPHVDADGAVLGDGVASTTLAEIIADWKAAMEQFNADRIKLGDLHGSEIIGECIDALTEKIAAVQKKGGE